MNIAILGYGSMGKRHAENLRALRASWPLIAADPHPDAFRSVRPGEIDVIETDWRRALWVADAVVIASPMEAHWEQIELCRLMGKRFLVEKPVTDDVNQTRGIGGVGHVGFCYRFHPVIKALRQQAPTELHFVAQDDLADRYGPTVLETMGSHAIDLALWMLGPAKAVKLVSDGFALAGSIWHANGKSTYNIAMCPGPRLSLVNDLNLYADDGMYLREMDAWAKSLEGWRGALNLATLDEGLAVAEVSAQVKVELRRPV